MSLLITSQKLIPRHKRLISSLLDGPKTSRELMDVIPTNNPAEYIHQLRTSKQLDIPCDRIKFETIDGTSSWYGQYKLTSKDREKLELV